MANKDLGGGRRPIDPGRTATTLAEAIERQANSQKRSAEKKAQKSRGPVMDPFMSLQQQLFDQMNGIQVAPTPFEELQRMAQTQVGAQFNPMIEALKRQMEAKQNRGQRSQGQAREMYGDLSKDLISQIPMLTQRFAEQDAQTEHRYDTASTELQNQYGKQEAEQLALMKKLGIDAASQEATQQAEDDQNYFQNQMTLDEQRQMDAMDQQQSSATTYQRSLGNNSKMAGENRAQEIGQMLEEYLTEAEGQMTGLQGQKSSAMAALLAQMQGQDAQRVQQQTESEGDRLMDLFRFQLDAMNSSSKAQDRLGAGSIGTFKGTSGLSGASNHLAEQYPDSPQLASGLMEQIHDVLGNKNVVRGKYVLEKGNEGQGRGPKYADVDQNYMIDLLRREFEKEGDRYSPRDLNSTIDALLAYMGKLR